MFSGVKNGFFHRSRIGWYFAKFFSPEIRISLTSANRAAAWKKIHF